jgi:hypothetical protein
MYVCMYIRMYVCMYVCMYVRMYTLGAQAIRMHVSLSLSLQSHIEVGTCNRASATVHVHARCYSIRVYV